jgi:hypothetical protein
MEKRTTSVTVKMSAEDFETLKRAADTLWPGAPITNSSIVLGLAKLGASTVKPKKKTKG